MKKNKSLKFDTEIAVVSVEDHEHIYVSSVSVEFVLGILPIEEKFPVSKKPAGKNKLK